MAGTGSKHLKVVADSTVEAPLDPAASLYNLARRPDTVAERVRRLQAEARLLALEEIERLELALREAGRLALEIAEGGDAYPVGIREHARQLSEEMPGRAASLKLLASRA